MIYLVNALLSILIITLSPSDVTKADDGEHDVVSHVMDSLWENEGTGDLATGIPTGDYGMTSVTKKVMNYEYYSDKDAATLYLKHLNNMWSNNPHYNTAPQKIKSMILDLSYNLGESVYEFKGLNKCLEDNDYECAALSTLDTANINGTTSIGIAARRAREYNKAIDSNNISFVEQFDDGEIKYINNSGEVLFSYGKGMGKHHSSISKKIKIR